MRSSSRYLCLNISTEQTVRLTNYSKSAVYGEKSGHLYIFTSLKHLMVLLRCIFSGIHLHLNIKDTDTMWGHAAQIFIKVQTLLNHVFKFAFIMFMFCFVF